MAYFFEEDEIKYTYLMLKKKQPSQSPKRKDVIKKSILGDVLGRKNEDELGSESIWIRFSRVSNSVFTLESIREFEI